MSELAEAVRDSVMTAIAEDRLQLPTMPEVALTVRAAAEQDDISASELAKVISADPGLAVRIVRVANSALYRGSHKVETVANAVSRLGLKQTCSLATGFAMQQIFQATSEVVDRKMRTVWAQSTQVASISAVLASNFTRLRADQALLAGLTHNIGTLPVLLFAEEHGRMIGDSITLDAVIEEIHGEIGALILRSWQFGEELAAVPSAYTRYDHGPHPISYVDVVMVAHLQRYAGTNHPCTQVDWSRIHAFQNLGLDPSVEVSQLDDIGEEIEGVMGALQ
jgi:HD-like signal output (HDOD) protein